MRDVKDYIDKELTRFVLANIIIVLLLSGQLDVLSDAKSISAFGISLANISIVVSPMYIYIFLLNYMYSSKFKTFIVYWLCDIPGKTVFSRIKSGKIRDPRFANEEVVNKYKDIFLEISEYINSGSTSQIGDYENKSWYKIYQKNKDNNAVLSALREELMVRDMCVLSFNLIILLGLLYSIGYGYLFSGFSFLFLFVVYILSNVAARYRAECLVLNVIAVDICSSGTN